jgi:hypothetical protein
MRVSSSAPEGLSRHIVATYRSLRVGIDFVALAPPPPWAAMRHPIP